MKYNESIVEDARIYDAEYGHLPRTQEELIKYLLENSKVDPKKLQERIDEVENIPWSEINLSFDIIPYATPRPRRGAHGTFYVRGAKKHKKLINTIVQNAQIIYTRTEFTVTTYQPTPKSVNQMEKILFEMGVTRPTVDPDWDNLGKTYSDMIQGILIVNDNIITSGHVDKLFSIRPRVDICIRYQNKFDCKYNERKMLKSKGFCDLVKERYDI